MYNNNIISYRSPGIRTNSFLIKIYHRPRRLRHLGPHPITLHHHPIIPNRRLLSLEIVGHHGVQVLSILFESYLWWSLVIIKAIVDRHPAILLSWNLSSLALLPSSEFSTAIFWLGSTSPILLCYTFPALLRDSQCCGTFQCISDTFLRVLALDVHILTWMPV